MKRIILCFLFFILSTIAYADKQCTTINLKQLNQEQFNMLEMCVVGIAKENGGYDSFSIDNKSGDICFDNPIFKVKDIITIIAIINFYNTWVYENDQRSQDEQTLIDLAKNELSTNTANQISIVDIDQYIDVSISAVKTLEELKSQVSNYEKMVLKYLVARRILNI